MRVTFCGHRQVNPQEGVVRWLDVVLSSLTAGGADSFYLGGYGDFDRLAAEAVRRQKLIRPEIESVLVLAYLNRKRDKDAAADYDRTVYPPLEKVPPRFAIPRRNCWMVDNSDILVAYVEHAGGGAEKMLKYAQKKQKLILLYPGD